MTSVLVTIGRAVMPIPDHPRIRPLGFVSGRMGRAHAATLIMPSPYESLSIALPGMGGRQAGGGERRCGVLREQAARASGSLAIARARNSLRVGMLALAAAGVLGRQGYEFMQATYSWRVESTNSFAMTAQQCTMTDTPIPARAVSPACFLQAAWRSPIWPSCWRIRGSAWRPHSLYYDDALITDGHQGHYRQRLVLSRTARRAI